MTKEEAIRKLQKQKAEYLEEWVDYSGVAEAYDMAIEALSAEAVQGGDAEMNEVNPKQYMQPSRHDDGKDLISRADAIEAIESRQTEQWIDADVDYNNGLESAVAEIKALPSAEPKTGAWINTAPPDRSDNIVCDQCGYDSIARYDYCPNCGAKMGSDTK